MRKNITRAGYSRHRNTNRTRQSIHYLGTCYPAVDSVVEINHKIGPWLDFEGQRRGTEQSGDTATGIKKSFQDKRLRSTTLVLRRATMVWKWSRPPARRRERLRCAGDDGQRWVRQRKTDCCWCPSFQHVPGEFDIFHIPWFSDFYRGWRFPGHTFWKPCIKLSIAPVTWIGVSEEETPLPETQVWRPLSHSLSHKLTPPNVGWSLFWGAWKKRRRIYVLRLKWIKSFFVFKYLA